MLDEGAVTRMQNMVKQGKRNQMVGPAASAAQASLRNQVKGSVKKPQNPVGDFIQPPAPLNLPTGGSPITPDPQFNVDVFKEEMVDNMVGQIRTQKFLNSPAAKDAQTSVILKEQFNQFNTGKRPDSRTLIDRVVNRMGINPNEESA